MQWLIDLIIETIGIPPVYIHRGDPAVQDYDHNDFTYDNVWHALDLSAVVPDGAKAVLFHVSAKDAQVQNFGQFERNGGINHTNFSQIIIQVADLTIAYDIVVACDEDRKIQYRFPGVPFDLFDLVIRGWWL